jgi:hypothetical protein
VHRWAVISLVAIFNISLSRIADALGLITAATTATTGPLFREPRGSCKQHLEADKMNLIVYLASDSKQTMRQSQFFGG